MTHELESLDYRELVSPLDQAQDILPAAPVRHLRGGVV
jgi:hypothetical protein